MALNRLVSISPKKKKEKKEKSNKKNKQAFVTYRRSRACRSSNMIDFSICPSYPYTNHKIICHNQIV